MRIQSILFCSLVFIVTCLTSATAYSADSDDSMQQRGKYLVEIGGCNDCHTAGFAPSGGNVPMEKWLEGEPLGFRGPWGTTYPLNLRQYFGQITEDEWVATARTLRTRPPMPWWAINAMTDDDLRALHRFVTSLGGSDNEVPSYVPPTEEPNTPFIQWPAPPE